MILYKIDRIPDKEDPLLAKSCSKEDFVLLKDCLIGEESKKCSSCR